MTQRDVEIIDPSGLVVGKPPSDIPALAETILPYFPEDAEMRKYLALISCGFSRKEALRKCGKWEGDLKVWREDESFAALDDLGYGGLRDTVASIYLELMHRRNAVQIMELDETILGAIIEKINNGIPLTNDEKLIYSKRAGSYNAESLAKIANLAKGINSEGGLGGTVIDWVAIVRGQVH